MISGSRGDPEFLARTSRGQLDGQVNFWFSGVRYSGWVLDGLNSWIHPRGRLEEFRGENCPGDSLITTNKPSVERDSRQKGTSGCTYLYVQFGFC